MGRGRRCRASRSHARFVMPTEHDRPMTSSLLPRRSSIPVDVGGVVIGGDAPIVVQSMTNTDTADVEGTARQCAALARAGSEIVRITVDRDEAAKAVPHIRDRLAQMGARRAAGRRLPLQRPHAAGREPRLRRGAGQVSHQSRQRRLQGQARPAVLGHRRDGAASTPSRCASASTGAASTRSCSPA